MMRKLCQVRGVVPLLVLGVIAAAVKWIPESVTEAMTGVVSGLGDQTMPDSEYYQLVPGSVYDGDTLRVTDGLQELKIRLCGIDAPEVDQPLGIEARDHLRGLLDRGDGIVIVLPIEQDQYDRTVAELFVPTDTGEIHLNSQMTYDGYAYHYEQYSDSCPNQSAIALGEERARAEEVGVWMDLNAVKPWDYRRQSKAH